jgi:protein gp37
MQDKYPDGKKEMNRTKIEWCDRTWNPVSGCLHECEYCYARKYVNRFGEHCADQKQIHVLQEPAYKVKCIHDKDNEYSSLNKRIRVPYPFGFAPTFHCYRLEEPQLKKQSQNVFVCSMADLFGDWVPDNWIKQVFEACAKAPQHRYLFLTKNPDRYQDLNKKDLLPNGGNFWFGTTATEITKSRYWYSENHKFFLSIEPIMERFADFCAEAQRIVGAPLYIHWVIVGAETGNRKGKVIPKKVWIEDIVNECRKHKIPVFLKDSLASIWGEPLIQEYPWEKSE